MFRLIKLLTIATVFTTFALQGQSQTCAHSPASRLRVGSTVLNVVPGDGQPTGLTVLSGPDAPIASGNLPYGITLQIVGGPVCSGPQRRFSLTMWMVSIPGWSQPMWVAEGFQGQYYLQPTSAPQASDTGSSPTDNVAGNDTNSGPVIDPLPGIPLVGSETIPTNGQWVRVIWNQGMSIRSGPGLEYDRIGRSSPGAYFGYIETENGWYRIRWDNGEGWVSGEPQYTTLGGNIDELSSTIPDVPEAPSPCPSGVGPGGITAGDYPPERLTNEQRQWLYEQFGNSGVVSRGYGGESCGEAFGSSVENFFAMICRRGEPGPGGILPGDYNPQDLSQEQRQWLFNQFGNEGNAPVGYGGERCPGQDTLTAHDVYIAEICSAGYVGPFGMAAGSYDPAQLQPDERQWLWNIFGNEGNAPVGYGGERCPGDEGNLPEPIRTQDEESIDPWVAFLCSRGDIGPGGIKVGAYLPQDLSSVQRQWLWEILETETSEAPVGYGGQHCPGEGLLVVPILTSELNEGSDASFQVTTVAANPTETPVGEVLGASTSIVPIEPPDPTSLEAITEETGQQFTWQMFFVDEVSSSGTQTLGLFSLVTRVSNVTLEGISGMYELIRGMRTIQRSINITEVTRDRDTFVQFVECVYNEYDGIEPQRSRENIDLALQVACDRDAVAISESILNDPTCSPDITWNSASSEVKYSDAFFNAYRRDLGTLINLIEPDRLFFEDVCK